MDDSKKQPHVDELREELAKLKKEKQELERHRKVMGQVAGRHATEEMPKRNAFTLEELEKLKTEYLRKYPDSTEINYKDNGWNMDPPLSDILKSRILRSIHTAEYLIDALDKLTDIEKQLELNKPVYYKGKVGLLARLNIYDEYTMDKVVLDDNRYAKNGDVVATVLFSSSRGSENQTVLAKDLLPYNESTKLLYERDKIK